MYPKNGFLPNGRAVSNLRKLPPHLLAGVQEVQPPVRDSVEMADIEESVKAGESGGET